MGFHIRVLLVSLSVLVVTLVLNSVLSLASYQKLHVAALNSLYELAGKNLQRRIQQSLRFGKPLDRFAGMTDMLKKTAAENPDLSEVAIVNADGVVLYHTDESKVGASYPFPGGKLGGDAVQTELNHGEYISIFPIRNSSNELVGAVRISFSEKVILSKLGRMALENVQIVWIVILSVSVGLVAAMTVLISSPVRSRLGKIAKAFNEFCDSRLRWDDSCRPDPQAFVNDSAAAPGERHERVHHFGSRWFDIEMAEDEAHRLSRSAQEMLVEHAGDFSRTSELANLQERLEKARQDLLEADAEIRGALESDSPSFPDSHRQGLARLLDLNARVLSGLDRAVPAGVHSDENQ